MLVGALGKVPRLRQRFLMVARRLRSSFLVT